MCRFLDFVEPYPVEEFYVTAIGEVGTDSAGVVRWVLCSPGSSGWEAKVKLLIPIASAMDMNVAAHAILTAEHRKFSPLRVVG